MHIDNIQAAELDNFLRSPGLCVMIAASIYTDRHEELHKSAAYFIDVSGGRYGYSFVLAWIAFAFTLISGVMYLILRKRK